MKTVWSIAGLSAISRLLFAICLASATGLGQSASSAANPRVTGFSGDLRLGREIVVNVANLSARKSASANYRSGLVIGGMQ